MHRLTLGVAVLALLVSTLAVPAPVRASLAFNGHTIGGTAFALFSSSDPSDPCVVTEAFVSASEGRVSQPPGPPSLPAFAFTVIATFHVCTGEVLLAAFGDTTELDFQVDRPLKSASLHTTMTVEDNVSGEVFDVTFDLAWTGEGEPRRLNMHGHSQDPGLIFNFHLNEAAREAVATGSISDGLVDFTFGESAEFAEIGWFSDGVVEVAVP